MSFKIIYPFLLLLSSCSLDVPLVSDEPRSFVSLRYAYTVPQKSDYTCGAASLATLLTFYLERPITELGVLNVLSQKYDKTQMREKSQSGLSFDDLIFVAERLGLSAQGAQISVAELGRLSGPVLVQLNKGNLKHFVVLRKVGDGVMYVSDPAIGQSTMKVDDFKEEYTGFALAVWAGGGVLPKVSEFQAPTDGLSVSNTLSRVINGPIIPSHPSI